MLQVCLIAALLFTAIQAVRAPRLLTASLWLAGVSALVSLLLYTMGAYEVAVIELSVGAGLVTVLFIFAINIAGEETMAGRPLVPKSLAWGLVCLPILLLGWLILPLIDKSAPVSDSTFADMLWQQRGLDILLQIALIGSGVLGLLGLLAGTTKPAGVEASGQKAEILKAGAVAVEEEVPA